jgi:hypothetical protein
MRVRKWVRAGGRACACVCVFACACVCVFACACGRTRVSAEQCPALKEYAKREGIPLTGKGWPDTVMEYSISHGPALTPVQQAEYTRFRVK